MRFTGGIQICMQCGLSHAPEDRQRVLARRIPARDRQLEDFEVQELRHMWPLDCFYDHSNAGYMKLRRDLIALGVSGNKRRRAS